MNTNNSLPSSGPSQYVKALSLEQKGDVSSEIDQLLGGLASFQKQFMTSLFGEKKGNELLAEEATLEVFTFKAPPAKNSGFREPIVCKHLAVILHENPKQKIAHLLEDFKKGFKKGEFLVKLKEKSEEKEQIFIPPQHRSKFDQVPVEFHSYNQKDKAVTATIRQPEEYNLTIFTAEQYARMTTAALRGLTDLSKTMSDYNKKTEDHIDGYPLKGRCQHQNTGLNGFLKEALTNLVRENQNAARSREGRQEQLKQEEEFQKERDDIKRRKTETDIKYENRVKRDIRSDELKALEKGEAPPVEQPFTHG